ncbi:hypothetical protein AT746_08780 [Lacimicrobium alkaliphilum]|uniref:Uncharacterized protein n=1 Tax=Lacimicrobium alkaliphilum TaxID=1526571 RepID=A0A0U3AK34_9ALTE|nr:hypothetical protein AT746_08780 [Lacimicrobium alkaliphilum]
MQQLHKSGTKNLLTMVKDKNNHRDKYLEISAPLRLCEIDLFFVYLAEALRRGEQKPDKLCAPCVSVVKSLFFVLSWLKYIRPRETLKARQRWGQHPFS